MTSEQILTSSLERRLADALHAAQARREQQRRREMRRKSRWLSSFSHHELERHHLTEIQAES
jgi:hypothetical protein